MSVQTSIVRSVSDADDVTPRTLLGICTTLKPAPGRTGGSATRSLLTYALESVAAVYPDVAMLDVREHRLPLFDGRGGREYADPHLDLVTTCVERASTLLIGVPGYWCGVSGVFKNLIDTLCGAAYDLPQPRRTVFTGKPIGLLVVGADDESGAAAAAQAIAILASTGATVAGEPMIVPNPRGRPIDARRVSSELAALAGNLAIRACRREAQS
jgi:NAD(P)H-dependent FMN reductase